MATQTLGAGSGSNTVESYSWTIDYDDVARNIGITADGQASQLLITLSLASGQTWTRDAAGFLGQGRVPVASIQPAFIPAPVPHGQDPGYTLTTSWTP